MLKLRNLTHLFFLLAFSVSTQAGTIYVDNLQGDDTNNGRDNAATGNRNGPVKTLARAMRLASNADTVSLANNSVPYYQQLSLTGWRNSGSARQPFRIEGNGATLSGAQLVVPKSWRRVGQTLWKTQPCRKGRYVLLLNGKPVERHPYPIDVDQPFELPEGKFAVCRGWIFFRTAAGQYPADQQFAIAQQTTGLSLYAVNNVIVRNLKLQHFRIDGINAHDLCRNVLIENVASIENGRSGLTVTGSSAVLIQNCSIQRNVEDAVRIDGRGAAEILESELDKEPTIVGELPVLQVTTETEAAPTTEPPAPTVVEPEATQPEPDASDPTDTIE